MSQSKLVKKRDEAIIHKFYELHDVKRMRLDDVLLLLSEKHFYLSKNYIYSLIFYNKENNALYASLLKSNTLK